MAGQSAKNKKIDIVMDEFGKGTLRSGKSDKRVTNPKQAIAIALSEAERLAHGGYIGEPVMNQYMNRPMFQTPQMREGGGIMAGIAPVRGYADGDEVSDDDRSDRLMSALSNLLDMGVDKYQGGTKAVGDIAEQVIRGGVDIVDTLGDAAYDLSPEDLQTVIDVLGEYSEDAGEYFSNVIPATEEDFWRLTTDSAHKKAVEAGEDTKDVPMNLQDLTDIVFDPDNPTDIALATLAASPTGFGLGNVAGVTGKVGQAIPRLDKLTGSKVSKGIAGLIDNLSGMTGIASRKSNPITRSERYGRLATTAYAPENVETLSNVLTDDEIAQSFIDAMEEAEAAEYANGGVATLKARDGFFVDLISGIAPLLGRIAGGAKRTLFGKPKKINKTETKTDTDATDGPPEPVAQPITSTTTKTNKGKGKGKDKDKDEEEEVTTTTTVTDDVIEESMGMPKKSGTLGKITKYGVGGAGLYWIGNKLFDEETNEEVDQTKLAPENIPPKPQVIDSSVMNTEEDVQNFADELTEENRSWVDKTFSRLRGGLGKAWDSLDDPRVRAGIMAAAKPVEGYTPINALVAATEGARQYDLEQAQLTKLSEDAKSDMEQLVDFYMTNIDTEGMSPEEILGIKQNLSLTLFQDQERRNQQAAFMELAKTFGTTEEGLNALNEVAKQYGGSLTPKLAALLKAQAAT
tara:strand:+ start:1010 stop:3067 length:2058 start_codon:yes stop_codon:yes gene_type:complete